MRRRWGANLLLAAVLFPAALAAQSSTVTVGPNSSNIGTATLYGSSGGSVALSVGSTGTAATSAILPYVNGNILVGSISSNFGDVVCSSASDSASTKRLALSDRSPLSAVGRVTLPALRRSPPRQRPALPPRGL